MSDTHHSSGVKIRRRRYREGEGLLTLETMRFFQASSLSLVTLIRFEKLTNGFAVRLPYQFGNSGTLTAAGLA
jgi:hypothetical protein